MPTVTLRAHYDGEHIVLDEPFDIPAGAQLLVMVLPKVETSTTDEWLHLATGSLGRAYGDAEPEYSDSDLKR